jgi:phosphoserine phosphatase
MKHSGTEEESLTSAGILLPQLSAEAFMRQVLESKPKVAVFDCDGTLWSGDAGYGFMAWSLEQGLVSRSTIDWVTTRYRAYLAGEVSELAICGEMVQMYAGLREAELRSAARRYFVEFVHKRIFPEMTVLLEALAARGVELWAVSSTNRWVIVEGLRHFPISEERILAAAVHIEGGVITDRLIQVPTDEEKAVALRRVGIDAPDAVFGNSIHDLAMLQMARRAFPVNPSPALVEAAAQNGWSWFRPAATEGLDASVGGEP